MGDSWPQLHRLGVRATEENRWEQGDCLVGKVLVV